MSDPRHPALYQINTRILIGELSSQLGRKATLDDLDDATLDHLAALGFDWVWFLGVWTTGPAGLEVSRCHPEWRQGYATDLPDCCDADVCGSPFAILRYALNPDFGGEKTLATLRQRLRERGMRLMLDFVPNHSALDHPWVESHPEYYIHGTDDDLAREPQNYVRLNNGREPRIVAYGRDPYFPGWPDTLQLNYRHPRLREAMIAELSRVAMACDGVRCDMAMLVLPDVFERTWGDRSLPHDGSPPSTTSFWPEAIGRVKGIVPGFVFLAEAYWDLEWTLQQQGFDYTYDKRLYDRLREREAGPVRGHLHADLAYQDHSARFLENHDEPRAAAVFPNDVHKAAAAITFLVPGMRFFHEGQLDGRRSRSGLHLSRRRFEEAVPEIREFYQSLLRLLHEDVVRDGLWRLLECQPGWDGNHSYEHFLVFLWENLEGGRLLVAVNYAPTQSQCYVKLTGIDFEERGWVLTDQLGPYRYEREGDDLANRGLYLDMPGWGYHAFRVEPAADPVSPPRPLEVA